MSLYRLLTLLSLTLGLLVGCGQIGEEPNDTSSVDDSGVSETGGAEICDNEVDDDGDGDVDCDDSDCDGDAACSD